MQDDLKSFICFVPALPAKKERTIKYSAYNLSKGLVGIFSHSFYLMAETWKPVGCYQNRGRALGKSLVKFKRFGKMQKKYGQCVTVANQKGITVFGLDDTRCWTGQNAASSYGIYGTAVGRCGSTKGRLRYGFFASETVFVYQKKGGKLMG